MFKFDKEVGRYTEVVFRTAQKGLTVVVPCPNGMTKEEVVELVEEFFSKPLTREWLELHKLIGCTDVEEVWEGAVRGDLLPDKTYKTRESGGDLKTLVVNF